jgi:hypothetical protein
MSSALIPTAPVLAPIQRASSSHERGLLQSPRYHIQGSTEPPCVSGDYRCRLFGNSPGLQTRTGVAEHRTCCVLEK